MFLVARGTSFSSEGFFSGEVDTHAQIFRDRNTRYFKLYQQIANLGYKTIAELQNNSGDVRRGIVTCLVIRTLSCYDAIRLTVEKGMEFESRVLLRSQLEAMYTVAACQKDKEFHKIFIQASTRDKLRLLSKVLGRHDEIPVYNKSELTQTVQDLETKLKKSPYAKLQTKEIAKKAGMESSYELVYSFYSLSVHINPISLQEYIKWDDEIGIQEIVWGPRHERACSYMLSSMNTMLVCLIGASQIFNLNFEPRLRELLKQWEKLNKRIPKSRAAE